MTLSRYLRDFLYIPLGGSRGGPGDGDRNLMITMLLGGLWHGAAWGFVLWGGLHGAALVVEHSRRGRGPRLPPVLAWAATFLFVCLAWIPFRAPDLDTAWAFAERLVTPGPSTLLTPGRRGRGARRARAAARACAAPRRDARAPGRARSGGTRVRRWRSPSRWWRRRCPATPSPRSSTSSSEPLPAPSERTDRTPSSKTIPAPPTGRHLRARDALVAASACARCCCSFEGARSAARGRR